jgi:hypothetical protein
MNRRRVGEDRGSKETDGCPLTAPPAHPVLPSAQPPPTLQWGGSKFPYMYIMNSKILIN